MRLLVCAIVILMTAAACGDDAAPAEAPTTTPPAAANATTTTAAQPETEAQSTTTSPAADDGCADVIDGSVTASGDAFTASATVRSDDTGEEKYADRWEVRTIDGEVLGERILTHPHVNEQPFTRSLNGLEIPDEIDDVVLVAHDSVLGFCGAELTVAVER